MDRAPNQNTPLFVYNRMNNRATSFNMANYGALHFILGNFTGVTITNSNYRTVQNNAQISDQVINFSAPQIANQYIGFGVDRNNNRQHQQSNESVQFAGPFFQPNQFFQLPMNYIYREPAYYSQGIPPSIISPMTHGRPRTIVVDGLNIGYAHGQHKTFSAKGMYLCMQYFVTHGFPSVKIMIPQHCRANKGTLDNIIISFMLKLGYIYFTPSRKIQEERMTSHTDRLILDYAISCDGVVVSNDNFRDLYQYPKYREIIEKRHIMCMFIDDEIIFPDDQYGQAYPDLNISNILHFPA